MKANKKDNRKHDRKTLSQTVTFSIVGSLSGQKEFLSEPDITGTIIDMSENGMGLFTTVPLEPGMLLKFNHIKGNNVGVIMWVVDSGSKYRVGLKFV